MSDSRQQKPETILVVDDAEVLRTFIVTSLELADFNLISADSGPNAIALAEKTKDKMNLLLTDWDMAEMSGIALGQALKVTRPAIRIMQMSGRAHDATMVLNYGWAFLRKPFVSEKLAEW